MCRRVGRKRLSQLGSVDVARAHGADLALAHELAERAERLSYLNGCVHDRERLLAALAAAEERGRGADAAKVAAAEDDPGDAYRRRPEVGSLHEHDATRRPGGPPTLLLAAGRLCLSRRAGRIAGAGRGGRRDLARAPRGLRKP